MRLAISFASSFFTAGFHPCLFGIIIDLGIEAFEQPPPKPHQRSLEAKGMMGANADSECGTTPAFRHGTPPPRCAGSSRAHV
jgi:hypothetical protein